MMFFYKLITFILFPFHLSFLLWRTRKAPFMENVKYRLGFLDFPVKIWIHGSSVGESRISLKLSRAIPHPTLVTCMTDTAYQFLEDKVEHLALIPMDNPFTISNAFRRMKYLKTLILIETEIWPCLVAKAKELRKSVVVVNGRISDKSFGRYKRYGIFREVFPLLDLVIARSSEDAERFKELGVKKVVVGGNIKFDMEGEKSSREELGIPRDKTVVTFGSVREGEEELVVRTMERLRGKAFFIVAPRHPERFRKSLFERFKPTFRSSGEAPKGDVLIVDTLGELSKFYSVSDVAVVCGSFLPYGGHNILEPISCGVPTIYGPHMENFKEEASIFRDECGAVSVSPDELPKVLEKFIEDKSYRKDVSEKGKKLLLSNRGALSRTVEILKEKGFI